MTSLVDLHPSLQWRQLAPFLKPAPFLTANRIVSGARATAARQHAGFGKDVSCSMCRANITCRAGAAEAVAVNPNQGSSDAKAEAPGSSSFEQTYQEASNFLRSLGLDNRAEIARILDIAMNPGSMFVSFRDRKRSGNPAARKLSVEGDMQPVLTCLLEQGLSRKEAVQIINEHPPVLCYSPEERLRPFFKYLADIGFENPAKLVVQRPSLLGLDVEGSLRRMVEYLQAQDYSLEDIARLMETTL